MRVYMRAYRARQRDEAAALTVADFREATT
jgi:hypothetical protein